ncbi:MAG: PH domain-containing protein [Clostridia bacterium]|nr:PH domain-containing protein [Clostridia bacterium]
MRKADGIMPSDAKRQHPIVILQYTYRYLFLLLVPLWRGLLHIRTPQGLYQWVRGTWIDLTAIVLLLTLSLLAWFRSTYALTEQEFILCRGLFWRRLTAVPRRHVATLLVEQPFLLRPLQVVRLSIDTDAGGRRRADFRLMLHVRHTAEILEQQPDSTHLPRFVYRAKVYRMLLLSLLSSNSLSGILLLAITFQRAGYLLGQGFQNRLLGDIEAAAESVKVIPRTAALLAFILIGGWSVAAIGNLLRHAPFRVIRCAGSLTIRMGAITRREYACRLSAVSYVDMRQTLGSWLLRLRTVFIRCIGYGKAKNTLSVLIPFCRGSTAADELQRLVPECRPSAIHLRPAPHSLFRYCLFPLLGMVLLYPLSLGARALLPDWGELIGYLTFMAYMPCLWLLAVRVIDRYTAGVSRRKGVITLRYARLFTLHTVAVPEDKLVALRFRQSPFQRRGGRCTLLVYTYHESRQPHRVLNLPLEKAMELLAFPLQNAKDV